MEDRIVIFWGAIKLGSALHGVNVWWGQLLYWGWQFSGGRLLGGKFSRSNFNRDQFFEGAIFRRTIFLVPRKTKQKTLNFFSHSLKNFKSNADIKNLNIKKSKRK